MLKWKCKQHSHVCEFKRPDSFFEAWTPVSLSTSWTFGKFNLCLVNRVKDFHNMRWHGWQRQGKQPLVVCDYFFFLHGAHYVKVKIQANQLFCLLYSKLVTLGNAWISHICIFLFCCFWNFVFFILVLISYIKPSIFVESSTPDIYRGYKKISQQNWPLSGKENCNGRHIIA